MLVGMEKTGLRTWSENLKRELSASGIDALATEYLAWNFHNRTELQHVILDLTHFSEISSGEVCCLCDGLYFFHVAKNNNLFYLFLNSFLCK